MEIGFFLKKFISFFVEPYGMVFSLFFMGLYFLFINKSAKAKSFLVMAFGLLFLFSYPPFSNFLIQNLEDKYPKYDYKEKVKYIHVLGGDEQRVIKGIAIYNNIKNSKLIFTGYAGDMNITQAKKYEALALSLGVNKNDIVLGEKPKDTKEEALFTKGLVGDKPFVLVTSARHMPRAIQLFKSVGTNPIPAPMNFCKEDFRGFLRAPDIGSFRISQIAMHEYIGILWSKLRSVLL